MNLEKVVFGFFIVLALTLNLGFVVGEFHNPDHHNVYEFAAVILVNLFATGLKLGDRSHVGALLLATSLVADLQLVAVAFVWTIAIYVTGTGLTPSVMTSIVSLAIGALAANVISVILLLLDPIVMRR
jgi:Ca2+/H+ antiporter, TMEM165/GDT1 family